MAKKPEKVEEVAEVEVDSIPAAEYDRRISLNVSDAEYINPSLDHYKRG